MKRLPRGPHITRFFMYRHFAKFRQSPASTASVLSISHSVELCGVLGLAEARLVEANYPEYSALSLPFPDESFDYVVSDQVLEHIEGPPQRVIDESFRVLKPGGLAIHTTCFINPIHRDPNDFWRFTPDGLALLGRPFSRIVDCGGWGNPYVWVIVRLGLRYDGIPERRWHPLYRLAMRNDPDWPISTWLIAQK
jgi:SAM-dependent methyltransferase